MHNEPLEWIKYIKNKYPKYFIESTKVLEVGSLNINGTVRDFFSSKFYIGLDIGEGPGVDLVCPIHEFSMNPKFDVVVSTEMLEHDIHWKESLKSMYENLKTEGLLILTCGGPTRQEHGTKRTTPKDSPFTTDYYKNISVEDFKSVLPEELFKVYDIKYMRDRADLVFYGIKP